MIDAKVFPSPAKARDDFIVDHEDVVFIPNRANDMVVLGRRGYCRR